MKQKTTTNCHGLANETNALICAFALILRGFLCRNDTFIIQRTIAR
jgi:hypothetical protein